MAGTISRGIKAPIITKGDDIVKIVCESVLSSAMKDGFQLKEKDVVAVTEAVVARADGNYATVDNIAKDIHGKFGDEVAVVFPILSRNRFAVCLKGIARGVKKVILVLSYPSDEVGNHLFDADLVDDSGVNPYSDCLTLDAYRAIFGYNVHGFTGVDYVEYYKSLIESEGAQAVVLFSNKARVALDYTKNILCCDIHTRERTKRRLLAVCPDANVLKLDNIMNFSVDGSGFNAEYGLLGSNKATENSVKLFPKNADEIAHGIQKELLRITGVKVEAMVYGDGAFKDPVGKIWELADPVVGVGFTEGLNGVPNELKLKFLADNDYGELRGDELKCAITDRIKNKKGSLKGNMVSEGTTPRRLTDLLGSLCDLTSGSGDKGTPIVVIQNYFNDYSID
ncbi:MAG: coenzyme F420-0:L-glutamate ligase [Clostridia bacterium]|nr:coenzyme F420-0:L-glutamate ligase [Clostridia bacterium]